MGVCRGYPVERSSRGGGEARRDREDVKPWKPNGAMLEGLGERVS